jgi:hypothetical protein
MPGIPALKRLREEDHKFESSLDSHREAPLQKKKISYSVIKNF